MMMRFLTVIVVGVCIVDVASAIDVRNACERDVDSAECAAQRGGADGGREGDAASFQKAQMADVEEYARIEERFEVMSNGWACAVTGLPLLEVPGDFDVFSYGAHVLSQAFLRNGQQYGSQVIIQYQMSRTAPSFSCHGVELGDPKLVEQAPLALIEMKESLVAWLRKKEVDAAPIISAFMPAMRSLYGRWAIARLMLQSKAEEGVPEHYPLPLLAMLDDKGENAEDRCSVGGQLATMYPNAQPSSLIGKEISKLLELCVTAGKISETPQVFGETLLSAGREEEARELFDIAVERGVLCNAYQRPEIFHRKDLTAAPMWAVESVLDDASMDLLDKITEGLKEHLDSVEWSLDEQTMGSFLEKGKWERTVMLGNSVWNESLCNSTQICRTFRQLANALNDANDAYTLSCNGSLVIDLWRVQPGTTTHRSTGATNMVLQLVAPIVSQGDSNLLVVSAGDETVRLGGGDSIVIDDSFENVMMTTATSSQPLVVLHLQLCHPEMHEKALDPPSSTCTA